MKDVLHFINGEFTASQSGKTFDKIDPATGKVIAKVASGDVVEVNAAVAAAKTAFETWGKLPQQERSRLLMNLAAAIDRRANDFIAAEVADTGKPWSLASHLDIPRGAANFVQFAEHFKYVATECWENAGQNALNYAIRRPTGVVAVISPWNLPLLLMTWKVAPALAAGNCVVVKPSRETPSTASLLGEIMNEVGIPKGVYNVIQGPGTLIGTALSRHTDVHALTFTGETTTGQTIMGDCAHTLKKLSFELGGKNPNIIFADAPLEECLEVTMRSSFANQGQVCLAGSRIYVERPLYETFVQKLVERAEALQIGDPMDPSTTMGSLVSAGHLERVMSFVDSARTEGATIRCGGKRVEAAKLPERVKDGAFMYPTIITDVEAHFTCQAQEIFGPVVTITPFDSEEEVIKLANATEYGLSGTVWTNDLRRGHRVAAAIDAGLVWINSWFLRDLRTPFGGVKGSGIGREGGVHSLEFYTELKNICVQL
jgi:aminomuconate-semialdehyde/2-hydroxymuconate-6-semialdehyde dehydrogenase